MNEEPIIDLIRAGYHPEIVKTIDEGYWPSYNKRLSRVYLRKGSHAIIVPIGYEWFAINYYNLKTIAEKLPLKVFISYPREDLWLAYKIQKLLADAGIFAYLAELYPEPGVTLWEKIKRMIENSDIVVVLWTGSSRSSAFVNQEIGYAIRCKKLIIPLVERGISVEGVLEGKEYIQFERGRTNEAFSTLCQALTNFIQRKLEERRKNQATVIGGTILLLGLIALLAAFGRGKKQ